MTQTASLTAAEVRRRLGHPVVDADGHFMEFMPLVNDRVLDHLEAVGGAELRERFLAQGLRTLDTARFQDDRRDPSVVDGWRAMPSWWGNPVLDPMERATAHLPRLLYERLDELGVDLMLTYPSWTLGMTMTADDELRLPACAALNAYTAELFGPYLDRLRPAAIIPMQKPAEAVAELHHAASLGHTLVVLAGHAARPIGGSTDPSATRLDVFGLDSAADYDPVWAACVALGLAPVFHSSLQYTHPARSITNYSFNHIGGIAHAHEALCKALLLGGVYRRFPTLRIGYLEGGVVWATSLLADALGHWDKRGSHAIDQLDPARLDVSAVLALVDRYGSDDMKANRDRLEEHLSRRPGRPAELDDFAAAGVRSPEELIEPLAERSFYGCEADDPLLPHAFGLHLAHRRVDLRPMLGTDVSHWDAPVMNEVLPEAYELLDDGLVDEAQFEGFTFSNAVRLHGGMNPRFFEGTSCEKEAAAVLAAL
jgi:predicted TIM-barrel fold metal-dependent hydrolase